MKDEGFTVPNTPYEPFLSIAASETTGIFIAERE